MGTWRTDQPLEPEFARAWRARLARSPHANFTLDPEFLRFEAHDGRLAWAALVDEPGRGGAMVLREDRGRLVCGWPWRWQLVIEDPTRSNPCGLTTDEAHWMFRHAVQIAEGRRLRFHTPVPPPRGTPAFNEAWTLVHSIDHPDSVLLRAMHPGKRRMVRRAQQQGYEVVETREHAHYREFAQLQQLTRRRHGIPPQEVSETPPPGRGWLEWDLPWMWLLVAIRDGVVESGLGDGLCAGGMLEGRAGASSETGRRDGAFALLSYEEARRGRDRGYRWINLGGDSVFKREISGQLGARVPIYCWLGGGRFSLEHRTELLLRRAREGTIAIARRLRSSVARILMALGLMAEWGGLCEAYGMGIRWL